MLSPALYYSFLVIITQRFALHAFVKATLLSKILYATNLNIYVFILNKPLAKSLNRHRPYTKRR